MDGGIKSRPLAGIAMGLITIRIRKYAIRLNILGDEDHLGDGFQSGHCRGHHYLSVDIKIGIEF